MRALLAVGIGLLVAFATPDTASAAVACAEIVNMHKLGIPSNIIIQTMKDSGTTYTAQDVECLQTNQVPDEVVAAARSMSGGAVAPVPKAGATAAPAAAGGAAAAGGSSAFEESETLGGSSFTPAAAEDAAEEPTEPTSAGSPAEVELAVEEFQAGRCQTSSSALQSMLAEQRYPDQESKIQYYLAKSLDCMGLVHGAQHYYLEVVRKGPSNPFFKYALGNMVTIAAVTGNDYEITRVVMKIPPEAFPRQARDQLHYLLGRQLFEREELSQASDYFAQVSQKSPFYMRAKYYEGVINQERGKLRSAVLAFREVIQAEPELQADPVLVQQVEDMKDLAFMNIARIYYGLQRLDNAASYYDQVDRDSTYWAESLYERAWTSFWMSDLNKTLGLLLTVDSPYFSDSDFIPEVTILRALTYFYLCEFPDVERTLLEFDRTHEPMKAEMEAFIQQYGGQKDLWDQAYDSYFTTPKDDSVLTEAVFARMLRNRDLSMLVRHLQRMDNEVVQINAQKAQWKDTIGQELLTVYEEDRVRYKKKAGDELIKEMKTQVRTLDDLLLQSEVIRFEVVDAQRADYEFKAKGDVVDAGTERKIDFATDPKIIYWPFNGEFWRDELGYYRYTEHGSCN
jgi:TolA-binding protein